MKKINVAFLLGAGTSVAIGMPTTSCITDSVLSEDNLRNTKRRFINHPPDENSNTPSAEYKFTKISYLPETIEFLNRLKVFAQNYNTRNNNVTQKLKREINYEDLFYMLLQIYDHEISNVNIYGSVMSTCLIDDEFRSKINNAVEAQNNITADMGLIDFLQQVARYLDNSIIDIITGSQNNIEVEQIKRLSIFVDPMVDNDVQINNIFSLNHDTLMEKLLQMNNINYCDGHENTNGKSELRRWRPELFDAMHEMHKNTYVRLMKLHGSIDRRYFNRVDEQSGPPVLGIYTGKQTFDKKRTIIKDLDNVEYHFPDNPRILVGTENKYREYLVTDSWELFSRFRQYLFKEVDILIACGYSFGDLPINAQLLEWVINQKDKKLIMVNNEDESSFKERVDKTFREYVVHGPSEKFDYIEADISGLSWERIKKAILR